MTSGIIWGVILISGAWFILSSVFYESRREIVTIYVVFYVIAFIFLHDMVFNAADFGTAIFALVMVFGCMVVGFAYLLLIPTHNIPQNDWPKGRSLLCTSTSQSINFSQFNP